MKLREQNTVVQRSCRIMEYAELHLSNSLCEIQAEFLGANLFAGVGSLGLGISNSGSKAGKICTSLLFTGIAVHGIL